MEEERRLFYVAITRARDKLYISSCMKRRRLQNIVECETSPFLEEIPDSLIERREKLEAGDPVPAENFFARMREQFDSPKKR
jgi:DNA helicase-2/ATP-dependent DNA helicase PcrA